MTSDKIVPFNRTWIVHAPWAHLHWSYYVIFLYDLTTPSKVPPILHAEGVTHELLVYALHPHFNSMYPTGLVDDHRWYEDLPGSPLLQPANYGYQFYARNDKAAEDRIVKIYEDIIAGKLNPDTDAKQQWNIRFQDAVSLRESDQIGGSGRAH